MNKKQKYAKNGKPIVHELHGKDWEWHLAYCVCIWGAVFFFLFSLVCALIENDWAPLVVNIFTLFALLFAIISKSKCSVIYRPTEEKKKKRKTTIIIVVVFFIIGIIYCMIDGASGGGYSSSRNDSDDHSSYNSKDGFIGSDGEYHSYNPAYGDDVNEWMENNW